MQKTVYLKMSRMIQLQKNNRGGLITLKKVNSSFQKAIAYAIVFCFMFVSMEVSEAAGLKNHQEINLWPGKAPGSEQVDFHNTVTERSKNPAKHDRVLTKIDTPTITAYLPDQPNGTAVIVAPGGGYGRIVLDKESGEFADWLNPLGVTVFLLHYRLPCDAHENAKDVPLEDGQRAVRLVRAHAAEWGLNPDKIGLMGCSAAGHLAAEVNAEFAKKVYAPVDTIDAVSARPDFTILGYPVITMEPAWASGGTKTNLVGKNPTAADIAAYSPEQHVTQQASPTFIFLANDDPVVPSMNGVLYYTALRKAGVAAELHVFRFGGHGFGIERIDSDNPLQDWPKLCAAWMKSIKMIP